MALETTYLEYLLIIEGMVKVMMVMKSFVKAAAKKVAPKQLNRR